MTQGLSEHYTIFQECYYQFIQLFYEDAHASAFEDLSKTAAPGYDLVELYGKVTMSLCLGDNDGIWEIACATHSWLSEACQRQGLQPRRINLEQGYDLYR